MMKQMMLVALAALALAMVGCNQGAEESASPAIGATPGATTYHGEVGPDSHGWQIIARFDMVGEDVVAADFQCLLVNKHEYVVEDGLDVSIGDLKGDLSRAGIYDMSPAGAVMQWHEQIAVVEEYFIENDSFDEIEFDDTGRDVDGVTSATIHFSEWRDAVAVARRIDEAVVTYAYEGPMDSHGWEPYLIYQVSGGNIVDATIDCFLADPTEYVEEGMDAELGDLKADLSRAGIYDMTIEGARMHWHEQAELLEAYLVENQSFSAIQFDDSGHDVDGVTGATIHFEEFAVLLGEI